MFRILANAAALHIRIKQPEYQADQETYQNLTDYPIPEDLAIEYADKQQYFEVCTFIRTFNNLSVIKISNLFIKKGRIKFDSGHSCF